MTKTHGTTPGNKRPTWVYHEQENCWAVVCGRQVWTIHPDGSQFKVTGYPESPGVYRETLADAQA